MAQLSVIVPVYNVEDYLDWCLDSLRLQTLEDIEIICVNDGSTDGSRTLLERHAAQDPRIRIIDKENGGLSSARNAGLREASADIVCFLDSDDRFTPDACQTILAAFSDPTLVQDAYEGVPQQVDVVTFGANTYPEEAGYPWLNSRLSPRNVVYAPFHPDILFKEMARPFAWRTACRTSFLRDNNICFDETLAFGEDQVFDFAIYPRAKKTVLLANKLYDYRVSREGSLMHQVVHDSFTKMTEHVKIARAVLEDAKQSCLIDAYPAEMMAWCVEFFLYETLGLSGDQRNQVARSAREVLKQFWASDDIASAQFTTQVSTALAFSGLQGKAQSLSELQCLSEPSSPDAASNLSGTLDQREPLSPSVFLNPSAPPNLSAYSPKALKSIKLIMQAFLAGNLSDSEAQRLKNKYALALHGIVGSLKKVMRRGR